MNAYQEVERLLSQISVAAHSPAITKASEQISVLCRAYMEPDRTTPGINLGLSTSRARMYDLLHARMGQIVSRSALMDACWHKADSEPAMKIIDVHIFKLRKKLPASQRIETVFGEGYRLIAA